MGLALRGTLAQPECRGAGGSSQCCPDAGPEWRVWGEVSQAEALEERGLSLGAGGGGSGGPGLPQKL